MASFLARPAVKKFLILSVYALLGSAAQAGLVPAYVADFVRDHVLEFTFVALGLGHVLPEGGKGKPQ
jgi:hypothetical protein